MFDPLAAIDQELAIRAGWTRLDDCLLYNCHLLHLLRNGGIEALRPQACTIRIEPDETCFGEGPAVWSSWCRPTPPPDGPPTFVPSVSLSPVVGTTTYVSPRRNTRRERRRAEMINRGLAYQAQRRAESMAAAAVAAAADAAARSAAMAAANRARASEPRWVAAPPGAMTVTDRRFHLANQHACSVRLHDLDRIELIRPDEIMCGYTGGHGAHHLLRIHTPWATTLFLIATHLVFPNHSQLVSGEWLPAGFEDKCHLAGKACPSVR